MENCKSIDSPINPNIGDKEVRTEEPLWVEEHKGYRSIVGSLCYIALKSGLDSAFAAGVLRSYVAPSTRTNMTQALRAIRHLLQIKEKKFKMEPEASK